MQENSGSVGGGLFETWVDHSKRVTVIKFGADDGDDRGWKMASKP